MGKKNKKKTKKNAQKNIVVAMDLVLKPPDESFGRAEMFDIVVALGLEPEAICRVLWQGQNILYSGSRGLTILKLPDDCLGRHEISTYCGCHGLSPKAT